MPSAILALGFLTIPASRETALAWMRAKGIAQKWQRTRDLQDVFAPPNGKVGFLWIAAYLGAKMCLEHLPDER
jgi:hypothetical protein